MKKTRGASKDLTFKYNQLLTDKIESRKLKNDSTGEILNNSIGNKK